jgi:hypothetical protein
MNISDMESDEMRELSGTAYTLGRGHTCAACEHSNIPCYEWRGPFAYSMRCALCRHEVPHTEQEHDALRLGLDVTP